VAPFILEPLSKNSGYGPDVYVSSVPTKEGARCFPSFPGLKVNIDVVMVFPLLLVLVGKIIQAISKHAYTVIVG